MVSGTTVTMDTSSSVEVPTTTPKNESEGQELSPETTVAPVATVAPAPTELECDFDKNPTTLYLYIQEKRWTDAMERATSNPEEAATWVSRKERNGKLRWRLLPLHAAIIFKAPEQTIQSLVKSHVKAANCKDDQGMLPLHLAFRNGSNIHVIHLLLLAYPEAVNAADRKGRVPLVLAQSSSSPLKNEYIAALERGPIFSQIAAAFQQSQPNVTPGTDAVATEAVEQENDLTNQRLEKELADLKNVYETEKLEWSSKIATLEQDLSKNQETSQVLIDHVNSLEAQLSSRSDTERFLATKIANLDCSLKDTSRNKELVEAQMQAEKVVLEEENNSLKSELSTIKEEMADLKEKYNANEKINKKLETSKLERKYKAEKQVKILEAERATALANSAVLEAQLKKKMETEHTLASQVSDLASKLAEATSNNNETTVGYVKRVDTLEMEKMALTNQVSLLTKKLQHVVKALNCMSQEQERIVVQASDFEETMHSVAQEQHQIMADAARQEQILIDAAREREQIVSILTRQAVEIERSTAERERIIKAVSVQSSNMEVAKGERDALFNKVTKQQLEMASLVTGIEELGIKESPTDSFDDASVSDSDDEDDDSDDDEMEVKSEVISAFEQDPNIEQSVSAVEAVEVVKNETFTEEEVNDDAVLKEMEEEEEEEEEEDLECRLSDGRTADDVLQAALARAEEKVDDNGEQ